MGIGFGEVIFILIMLAAMGLLIAGIVWLIGTASKSPKANSSPPATPRNSPTVPALVC